MSRNKTKSGYGNAHTWIRLFVSNKIVEIPKNKMNRKCKMKFQCTTTILSLYNVQCVFVEFLTNKNVWYMCIKHCRRETFYECGNRNQSNSKLNYIVILQLEVFQQIKSPQYTNLINSLFRYQGKFY